MEQIRICNTRLICSRIGLGTCAIGSGMQSRRDEQQAIATVRSAVARGVTLIDTAPEYGFGRAEEIVGKALSKAGLRDRVVIATKVGLEWRNAAVTRNASAKRIRKEVEDSLRRLRSDWIDLYQVHWPDAGTPLSETASALDDLLEAGKIRAIGVGNFTPAQIQAFRRDAPLHAVQSPYNLFERGAERDVLPYAERHGLTVLAHSPLCRGLLAGKITPQERFSDDLRRIDLKFQPPRLAQYLAAVAALNRLVLERYGRNVLALALRWILDQGGTIALWGAHRPEQLDDLEQVAGWSLDSATMRDIDRILAEHVTDPVGPEFMAPPEGRSAAALWA